MGSYRGKGIITKISGREGKSPLFVGIRLVLAFTMCLWSMGPAVAIAADEIAPTNEIAPITTPEVTQPSVDAPAPIGSVDGTVPAPETSVEDPNADIPAIDPGLPANAIVGLDPIADNGSTPNDVVDDGGLNIFDDFTDLGMFIIQATYSISGRAYLDSDNSGHYDTGEGLSGWTINIDHSGYSGSHYTATTGSDGSYSKTGVTSGTYDVSETLKDSSYAYVNPSSGEYSNVSITSNKTGYDFRNKRQTYTISGKIYEDTNGDGGRDYGEDYLSGWTVNLSGSSTDTDTTDSNGAYSFTVLAGGNYTVSEVTQTGYEITEPSSDTYSHSSLSSNKTSDDFGNRTFGTYDVSGYVKNTNGDNMNYVTVTLKKGSSTVGTDRTDSNGYYRINGTSHSFKNGDALTLTSAVPDDYRPTTIPTSYTCNAGATYTNENFTVTPIPTYELSGQAWVDLDADDTVDEGEALSGWTIKIDHTGSSGKHYTTTTDANGFYTKTVLEGSYNVTETLGDTAYTLATPVSGAYESLDMNANCYHRDFKHHRRHDFSISGKIYDDLNGDGNRDHGETYLSGVTVTLTGGEAPVTTTTDEDGEYKFCDVDGGYDYTVTETPGEGYTKITEPSSGLPVYTHDHLCSSKSDDDFGNYIPVSISGTKFNDLNNNGIWDAGEPPMAGVRIYIDLDNDGEWDNYNVVTNKGGVTEPSVLTGADGTYALTDFPALEDVATTGFLDWFNDWWNNDDYNNDTSTYYIREVAPDEYVQTCPADAEVTSSWDRHHDHDNNDDDKSVAYEVPKISGGTYAGLDFGNYSSTLGSIVGILWDDLNTNQQFDPSIGETLLSGWTVWIDPLVGPASMGIAGTLTGHFMDTLTDANGFYGFYGLAPGSYIIGFIPPVGSIWESTYPGGFTATVGVSGGIVSDPATQLGFGGAVQPAPELPYAGI